MERNYKLYVHIAPNGKKYYGITKMEPEQRWANGRGYKNQFFARAINKYGWNNIQHIVLQEGLDEEEAKELEQYMIQWYDTTNHAYGYNVSLGGESAIGHTHIVSEETRQKMRENNTGENNPMYGRTGENSPWYGRRHTEETKQKMREAHRASPISTVFAPKSIICTTTNKIFYSIKEAAKYYTINRSNISQCCGGRIKTAGRLPDGTKLVWRYIDIIEL